MEFLRGLAYPFRGFAILRRHPGLARYWLPPIFITLCALIAGSYGAVAYHDDLLNMLWAAPARDDAAGVALSVLHAIVRALAFVLALVVVFALCLGTSSIVAAPFNDALSEAIEIREQGRAAPPFSLSGLVREVARTVRAELLKLCVYVSVMGPLLVASWVLPGVGQVLYVAFGALFTTAYLAFDYIDWPASRRGLGIRDRLAVLRERPLRMLGFGTGVWMCLFVPLLNLAFMPLAVAGGTRLFLDLESERSRSA
jgi:CysZ protein